MVSESREHELSAGVRASVRLRKNSRHAVVGGDSVYEGPDAGLHEGHAAVVQARTAAVRAAKLRKKRADRGEAAGEQSEQLTRTQLDEIFPGEGGRARRRPSPARKAKPKAIREIVRLRAAGLSGRQIGERLGISKSSANRIAGGGLRA